MAIKLKVEFSSLQLQITKKDFASLQSSTDSTTLLEFVDLKTRLDFVNLDAILFLDSDTKNLYFIASLGSPNAESFGLTDLPAKNFGLGKTDAPIIGDQDPVRDLNLGKSETTTVTEELSRVVQYVRGFTDTPSMSEAIASLDTSLGKTDAPIVSEELAKLFDSAQADTTSISDSPVRNVGLGKDDSVTFTDPVVITPELAKSDSISFADDPALETGKAASDTTSISEDEVKAVGKNVDDGQAANQTFTVVVQSYYGANKYYIDGVRQDTLSLKVGATYTFDQSDSSNAGHPLRLSTTSNGTHGGGSAYTTNVTTNGTAGSSGAYTRIVVTGSTPSTLYYYCTNHSAMGGQANVSSVGDLSVTEALARVVSYIRTFSDAYALDDLASAEDNLATLSSLVKNNVFSVSDLPAFAVVKPGITDSLNVTESTALEPSLGKSDSVGPSDAAPTFVISLAASDSLSLSEVLSLGGQNVFSDQVSITETTNLNSGDEVQDTTAIVENLVSEFGSNRSDTLTMSEDSVLTFSKSLTDNATISESVDILFIPGGGSILNSAALNTFVLN